METKEESGGEGFLKIDNIWSEAEGGNIDNITVKEEVLDLEPENILEPETKNGEVENFDQTESLSIEDLKQKLKEKFSSISLNEKDLTIDTKTKCFHNHKNFKIIKCKLRCGDCRSLICPECWCEVSPNLQSHFSNVNNHSQYYFCKICQLLFYSICAFQAHVRTHSLKTPYVCPDCGLIYNNLNYLTLHLINKCYHVYKVLRYKCKSCSKAYLNHEMFLKHIYEQHIQFLLRCSYCSQLCNDSEAFNDHITKHKDIKVYILKYFRCLLCSELVKPRFMLEKHMSQHCNSPEFLEVDYQCLCGYMYSYIGAFRAHIQHCNQKGLLPSRWSFLQKRLKHEQMIQIRNGMSPKTSQVNSNLNKAVESEKLLKLELLKSNEESLKDKEEGDVKSRSLISLINKKEVRSNGSECAKSPSEIGNEAVTNEIPPDGLVAEGEVLEEEIESAKIVYDHIPCDHLGYLTKTQNVESNRKDAESPESPLESFQIIAELDEKTGVMTTKKVPVENTEDEVPTNDSEDAPQYTNVAPKLLCVDKPKPKFGLFDCPFCTAYFPKHVASFQQFRLHIESYHPDAALDIVVEQNDPKPVETCESRSLIKPVSGQKLDKTEGMEVKEAEKGNEMKTSIENNKIKDLCWSMELSLQKDCQVVAESSLNETQKTDKTDIFGVKLQNVKTEGTDLVNSKESSENVLEVLQIGSIEECGEASRDSVSCLIEDSKPQEPESEPKIKLRRESEVWSELYESLMVAEKLKKKKEVKTSPEEKSAVANFSTKRVVKKPKRYGESSESGSGSEMERSCSDGDEQLEKPAEEVETIPCDIPAVKKQKLISKLQNVDSGFVDYLFHLISKSEKCYDLYKKKSETNEDRRGQELRSHRKKVLNGIKNQRKPVRILRYRQLLVKKEDPELGEEEKKTPEKKRGRPRKVLHPIKVKERRRSDREVDFIEKNFDGDESEASSNKRKRKLSSKLQYYKKLNLVEEKDDFSSGLVITTKVSDASKKLICAVCKKTFQEVMDFKEHIVSHRMEENSYQCMECGECFVVRPSLEKHLHAFHKIRNTDKYIEDNKCCNAKKETGKSAEADLDKEPLKENQCKVCKDQFERALDLTKHFRIHGMAFLKEFRKDARTK